MLLLEKLVMNLLEMLLVLLDMHPRLPTLPVMLFMPPPMLPGR